MLTSVKIIGPYPATDTLTQLAVPIGSSAGGPADAERQVTAIPLDENGEAMPAWKMSSFAWTSDDTYVFFRSVLSANEAVGVTGKVGGNSPLTVVVTEAETNNTATASITLFT